jgi:hypothetical protein
MTVRRVLSEIGRHPIAGVWMMAQLLLPVAFLLWLPSEPAALWGLFLLIMAMAVLQLPASVAGFWVTPFLLQLPPSHDDRFDSSPHLAMGHYRYLELRHLGLRYPCCDALVRSTLAFRASLLPAALATVGQRAG